VDGEQKAKTNPAQCPRSSPSSTITAKIGRSIYNGVMIETIYRTQTPEKGKSECYVLVLTSRVASGGKVYAFMEEHGQWNDDLQRFTYNVRSINTEEQLSYEHAVRIYETARRNLAGKGFVHCFAANGVRKEPSPDPIEQPEMATA
jgi:hypothetical protein